MMARRLVLSGAALLGLGAALENDNRSASAIGDVRYRELATLDLLSTEPST